MVRRRRIITRFLLVSLVCLFTFYFYQKLSSSINSKYRHDQRQKVLSKLLEIKWLRERLENQKVHHQVLQNYRNQKRPKRSADEAFPTSSDLYCLGDDPASRTCRAKNVCIETGKPRYFVLKGNSSFFYNVPWDSKRVVDLTTLNEHNLFYWNCSVVPGDYFTKNQNKYNLRVIDQHGNILSRNPIKTGRKNLIFVKGSTHLAMRFFPTNVMHSFHDDLLGLYFLKDIWPSLLDSTDFEHHGAMKLTKDQMKGAGLVTFDWWGGQTSDEIYNWVGVYKRLEELIDPHTSKKLKDAVPSIVCFEDAVIGNSKGLAWYQYGFVVPQGPIPNHQATGYKVREAASYFLRKEGYSLWSVNPSIFKAIIDRTVPMPENDSCIAIFSRKSTRLILNESDLEMAFTQTFRLPICWIRLEDHSVPRLIGILRKAVMAFGMHGSLLILSIFMPPGSVLIEGYPYGVPAENYTPYRTMAQLNGMKMSYRSWTAKDPSSCLGHPDRAPGQGGINHLNETYKNFILNATTIPEHLCCSNPHWLYRIFQDTKVNPEEVVNLMKEALIEQHPEIKPQH